MNTSMKNELLFGQEFYEGLSSVVRHQYLRKAEKIIKAGFRKRPPVDREKLIKALKD